MDGWLNMSFDFWLAIGTRGHQRWSSYWTEAAAAINTLIGMTGKRDSSSDICIIRRFYVPFSSHINTENSLRQATDRQHNRPPPSACCLPYPNPIPSNPWLQLQHLVRQHLLGHLRGSLSGGARGGIFNFKWWRVRHRDHLPPRWGWAPSHRRNTVSCFPSIGLTIKHEIESNR